MPTETQKNTELEKIVKGVINILADGQKGLADIGGHMKDETLKRYLLAESLKRASFRAELENELHRHGVHDVHEEGTTAGTLKRTWFDMKEKMHQSNDNDLLATAEAAAHEAKEVYMDALLHEMPEPLRRLLAEQNLHILSSYNYVCDHRKAATSK